VLLLVLSNRGVIKLKPLLVAKANALITSIEVQHNSQTGGPSVSLRAQGVAFSRSSASWPSAAKSAVSNLRKTCSA
jgi:hypothetical protein